MRRILTVLSPCLAIVLVASAALAQTTTTVPTQATTSPQSTPPTQSSTSTSSSTQGAFDKLSPGGQKIATALYKAQPQQLRSCSSSSPCTLTLDQIAAKKQHMGWGEIFKLMKKEGLIPSGVKNLGQLVSGRYQARSGTSGTTITTASGKSQVVGGSGSQLGQGHFRDDSSVSSAGGGQSSASSHGNGRAK